MRRRTSVGGVARLVRRLELSAALPSALAEAGEAVAHQARDHLRAQEADAALVDSVIAAASPSRVDIGTEHPAGPAAEFGTLHQAPRPWLQPAFAQALSPVRARLRQAVKDHLTRSQRTRS